MTSRLGLVLGSGRNWIVLVYLAPQPKSLLDGWVKTHLTLFLLLALNIPAGGTGDWARASGGGIWAMPKSQRNVRACRVHLGSYPAAMK